VIGLSPFSGGEAGNQINIGYSGGFCVGKQPKKVGRMFTPMEMNCASLPGSGGNAWCEDCNKSVILAAEKSGEVPLDRSKVSLQSRDGN
jgi:hypothetical protein